MSATGTWSGTSQPALDFTVGIKMDSDTTLLANNDLVVDLDDNGVDEDDVTVAHRIYVPEGTQIERKGSFPASGRGSRPHVL